MMEYIFDGKPHALDDDYGYITEKLDYDIPFFKAEELKLMLIREYIKYRINTEDEKILDILVNHFFFYENGENDFCVIYRPPWVVSHLCQYGTISLKFKRYKNDGLE